MRLRPLHILIFFFIALMAFEGIAQDKSKADKLIEQNRFADAAKVLQKKVKKSPESPELNEQLGFSFMKLHEFTRAEIHFAKADLVGGLSKPGLIHYGQVLIKNQKNSEAVRLFERYIAAEPDNFIAQLMLRSISEVKKWKSVPSAFELKPTMELNSSFSDFSPVPYRDGLVFATERYIDHINENSSSYNNAPYLALYFASMDDKSPEGFSFDRPKPFLSDLKRDYHVGPIGIDTVHNTIAFTIAQSKLGKNKKSILEVRIADLVNGKKIKNERSLLGITEYSVAHASFSPDGNAIVFSSDIEGGQGQMDLYLINKTDSGWTSPINLSTEVNTPLNELFPYFYDASTIYFASNGHTGYGGLDIYITEKIGGEWMMPENLKAPINSAKDDFGVSFINANKGYFSSSREGGMGKDDIYGFIKIADLNDTQRVEISGVFEYGNLPSDGVTLSLLDEFDNLLGTVQTDSNGNFAFSALPVGNNYSIRLDEENDDMLLNANIFVLNDAGEKVQILERDNDASFVFTSLPKDQIESLAILYEEDTSIETYDIYGQLFQKLGADLADIELIAYGPEGQIFASAFTDSSGYYQFLNLPKNTFVTIKQSSNDSTIYRSSVFYADEFGIERLDNFKNEFFEVELKAEPQDTIDKDRKTTYTGFLVYQERPLAGIPIIVFDSVLKITEVAVTSAQGSFQLFSTEVKSNYRLILPDSFNKKEDTCQIYLIDKATNNLIYANYRDLRSYDFTTLPPIEEQLKAKELAYLQQPLAISGKVYQKLPGDFADGLNIYAYDLDGNVVEIARTDETGEFRFVKLRPDRSYSIVPDMAADGSFKIIVSNDDAGVADTLQIADLQNYVFEKLESERITRLEAIEEEDFAMPGLDRIISGQIYHKLPGDYAKGIKIYAFDDNGNVLDSTLTDGKGGFIFNRVGFMEDFSIKVMEEKDKELKVALFNYDGAFKGLLFLDQENSFKYSKIILEAAADLETHYLEDESQGIVYGQIFKQLPGDYKSGMTIYAFDEQENVIDAAKMDDNGNFAFSRLVPHKQYLFRLDESVSDFNIAMLDASGNIIDKNKVVDGAWTYGKIQTDRYNAKQLAINESQMIAADEPKQSEESTKKPVPSKQASIEGRELFQFEFRDDQLTETDFARLKAISEAFKENPEQIISIESHAGSDEKQSQQSISGKRTAAIAQYLFSEGVLIENMMVMNWETSKPIEDCQTKNCTEIEKSKNRIAEVSILDPSAAPSAPNYVMTYDFNKWLLNDEAEGIAYQLIKEVKNRPEALIQIDGFTDTWGAFESNTRISELRAINIKNLLIMKGVSAEQININFHGEVRPKGECILYYPCPIDYRSQNRRIEVRLE